jgi:hypothetical protein
MSMETRTITEFVRDNPDVDSMEIWRAYWDILSGLADRIFERFELERHPASAGLESWEHGAFEGSLNTYTGPQVEWFVHSWIGNRRNSILDMNVTVWLGPHIDVPHLALVLGTVPHLYHYSDLLARRDLAGDADYLQRYYEPENPHFLEWRGDERFEWSVSHGTYMRAVLSPVGYSFMTQRSDEHLAVIRERVEARFDRWLAMVDAAEPVPEEQRAALRTRDHYLREHCYTLDPMNELAKQFMGPEMVERLVPIRYGREQMAGR